LDGELWCGRGLFEKCVSIVKKKDKNVIDEDWKYITYLVFDAPAQKVQYEERVKWLQENIPSEKLTCYAEVVGIKKCNGKAHLDDTMKAVLAKGGEGIMLRAAKSNYEEGRTKILLKVKASFDEEALVIGYKPGEGRNIGAMGALECELPNKVVFHVGTGFTDAQRKAPPKKGDVITFKFQEVSKNGHPRFPVYLRIRADLTWEDVCQNAKSTEPMSHKPKIKSELNRFSTVPSIDASGDKIGTDENVNIENNNNNVNNDNDNDIDNKISNNDVDLTMMIDAIISKSESRRTLEGQEDKKGKLKKAKRDVKSENRERKKMNELLNVKV
jgi:DNA ligase-1